MRGGPGSARRACRLHRSPGTRLPLLRKPPFEMTKARKASSKKESWRPRAPRGRRPRDLHLQSPQVLFPTPSTPSSTSRATTSRWPRARCAAPAAGPTCWSAIPTASAGEFFYQKRAPTSRPDWIEVVSLRFPSGRSADEVVPRDAAALAWLANLGLPGAAPASGSGRRSGPSRRAARRPRSGARRRLAAGARGGPRGRRRRSTDFGLVGLAQDLGLARHARQRADRAALELRPGAARGAGAGARGRAAGAGDRHQQVVEGGAARRVRGLQPERQGPHRRRRPTRCGRSPTRAVSAPLSWDEVDELRARATSPWRPCPARFAEIGDRHEASTSTRLARIAAELRRGTSAKAGRRALAAALPEAAGRAGGCSRPRRGPRSIR